jgi:hypothetical protein
MVKVLTAGGRNTDLPMGPVYFSRDYVRRGWFGSTTTRKGAVASFSAITSLSGNRRKSSSSNLSISP